MLVMVGSIGTSDGYINIIKGDFPHSRCTTFVVWFSHVYPIQTQAATVLLEKVKELFRSEAQRCLSSRLDFPSLNSVSKFQPLNPLP